MSLLEELLAESIRRGPACSIGITLESMDEEMAADWRAALAHPRIASTRIADRLTKQAGIQVKASTVQRHRRGDCQCPSSKS